MDAFGDSAQASHSKLSALFANEQRKLEMADSSFTYRATGSQGTMNLPQLGEALNARARPAPTMRQQPLARVKVLFSAVALRVHRSSSSGTSLSESLGPAGIAILSAATSAWPQVCTLLLYDAGKQPLMQTAITPSFSFRPEEGNYVYCYDDDRLAWLILLQSAEEWRRLALATLLARGSAVDVASGGSSDALTPSFLAQDVRLGAGAGTEVAAVQMGDNVELRVSSACEPSPGSLHLDLPREPLVSESCTVGLIAQGTSGSTLSGAVHEALVGMQEGGLRLVMALRKDAQKTATSPSVFLVHLVSLQGGGAGRGTAARGRATPAVAATSSNGPDADIGCASSSGPGTSGSSDPPGVSRGVCEEWVGDGLHSLPQISSAPEALEVGLPGIVTHVGTHGSKNKKLQEKAGFSTAHSLAPNDENALRSLSVSTDAREEEEGEVGWRTPDPVGTVEASTRERLAEEGKLSGASGRPNGSSAPASVREGRGGHEELAWGKKEMVFSSSVGDTPICGTGASHKGDVDGWLSVSPLWQEKWRSSVLMSVVRSQESLTARVDGLLTAVDDIRSLLRLQKGSPAMSAAHTASLAGETKLPVATSVQPGPSSADVVAGASMSAAHTASLAGETKLPVTTSAQPGPSSADVAAGAYATSARGPSLAGEAAAGEVGGALVLEAEGEEDGVDDPRLEGLVEAVGLMLAENVELRRALLQARRREQAAVASQERMADRVQRLEEELESMRNAQQASRGPGASPR